MSRDSVMARLDRLESLEAIRQLPPRYSASLDMRDWDALVNLFVDDVGVPGGRRGRAALKQWFDELVRRATVATAHLTANHVIDLYAPDRASGLVYSRNEIELDDHWMFEMMVYLDKYERRGDRWYFRNRTPLFWYQADSRAMPFGSDDKLQWPGKDAEPETWHPAFPTWQAFQDDPAGYGQQSVPPEPDWNAFVEVLRRGASRPRVNPSGAM